MHQLKGSLLLLLGRHEEAAKEFTATIALFNISKSKEREKHFIEDSDEFEDEWSEV